MSLNTALAVDYLITWNSEKSAYILSQYRSRSRLRDLTNGVERS